MRKGLWIALGACVLSGVLAASAHGYVYWTVAGPNGSGSGTTLGRADQDGSAANHAFVSSASDPGGIAVDSAHIYWANAATNSIGRANLNGSAANAGFIPHATNVQAGTPSQVAVDQSHIYWTDGTEYIGRANLDGSGAQPHWLDDGFNSGPSGVAVYQGTLYFADQGKYIKQVPAAGGAPQLLATLPDGALPTSITIAGGFIYYAAVNFGSPAPAGTVGRVSISGGVPTNNFVAGLQLPTGVASDGQELYWVDHSSNTLGRAQLTGSGVTNVAYSWISEPGGPGSLAIDANVDPTQTGVSCSPSSITPGSATSCTATVTDAASGAPPTGTVAFSSNATTFFSGSGSSCTLAPAGDGTYACTVGADSTSTGTVPITATYQGDALHQASSANTAFCSGSSSQCGGGSGPGGPGGQGGPGGPGGPGSGTHVCIVPKLKGKTLSQARKLLAKAHCKLGKVRRPKHNKRHRPLMIVSQQPGKGTHERNGAKVSVRLGPRPAKKHRR